MPKQTKTSAKSNFGKLADYLQQQRRSKRISIRKVSQLTSLPESTIRALENPNRSKLPSSNVIGLYKVYGQALGVSEKRIRDLSGKTDQDAPEFSIKKLPKLKALVVFSNIGTQIVVAAILAVIVGYALVQGFSLVSSPDLEIAFPQQEYTIVDESVFELRGTAPAESTVLINGEPTTVNNETGNFSQVVFLQPGYNYITVEVVNSFASSATKSFVVIYQPSSISA